MSLPHFRSAPALLVLLLALAAGLPAVQPANAQDTGPAFRLMDPGSDSAAHPATPPANTPLFFIPLDGVQLPIRPPGQPAKHRQIESLFEQAASSYAARFGRPLGNTMAVQLTDAGQPYFPIYASDDYRPGDPTSPLMGAEGRQQTVTYFYDGQGDDLALLEDPARHAWACAMLGYCLADTAQLIADVRSWASDWSAQVLKVAQHCPVAFIQGDANQQFPLADVQAFCALHANLQATAAPGAAQLTLLTPGELVVQVLRDLAPDPV